MRKGFALFATLVVALSGALTGCTLSSVDPDSPVQISGRVLDASGKPLAGAQVLLFKQADLGEVVFGTVLAVGTLSTVCLLPEPPAICRKARIETADSDGRYQFELKGSDTQGTLGTEATLNVVFAGAAEEGSTTVSFNAKETDITLPDGRLWKAAPKVSRGSGQIRLSWSALPSAVGRNATYAAQLFPGDSQGALWSQPASGGHAAIDSRILEDQPGSAAVSASIELPGGNGAANVRASYLSNRRVVRASSGPPPSRGRPCAAATGRASLTRRLSSCAATDGDLQSPARLDSADTRVVTGVVIDLGASRPVRLVVARGFSGQILVEVSDDGRVYRTVATSAGPAVALSPAGRPSGRFVRLRSPAGLDQSLLSEVSVW